MSFGYVVPATVNIYEDINQDKEQNGSEPGIAGVDIVIEGELFRTNKDGNILVPVPPGQKSVDVTVPSAIPNTVFVFYSPSLQRSASR
eukprot:13255067-Ditylum_brightwellii.AAC.1